MSTNVVRSIDPSVARVDLKLEVVVIPVSDVDRAKEFYARLGWRLDADFRFDNGFADRSVHATRLGVLDPIRHENLLRLRPVRPRGYLIVSDIEAARDELVAAGSRWATSSTSVPGGRAQRSGSTTIAVISHAPRSAIPTATAGCCRRLRPGFPGALTLA